MAFAYRDGALCAESVPLDEIAQRFGTPCYVYSRAAIERNYRAFAQALAGRTSLIAYSVKANSSLAVLSLLRGLGAGFDIVSSGELARVRAAGGDPRRVLFSGVGKTAAEIRVALEAGVLCINLESEAEMWRVVEIAGQLGRRAPVAFRVNPDVDPLTHPYISTGLRQSKFGVAYGVAERLYQEAARQPNLEVIGIGCHVGSQLVDPAPLAAAAGRIAELTGRLAHAGIALTHIDIGGGIGIRYRNEATLPVGEFLAPALEVLRGCGETLIVDPGRAVVGSAGVLLTQVEYVKPGEPKNFLVVDAAMNDLLRPALYDAWHEVLPVRAPEPGAGGDVYDIVGPVCESADFLARERRLAAQAGDLLAVMCAGAYGMVMSSNYNSRPRAAEVLVDGREAHLVRRRETAGQLFALETIPR
jgi:diaminopimelate decarboxylase